MREFLKENEGPFVLVATIGLMALFMHGCEASPVILGADFVVTQRLPAKTPRVNPSPNVKPAPKPSAGCQCSRKCGSPNCHCQENAAAACSSSPIPGLEIDHAALQQVMDEMAIEATVFAPTWCPACPAQEARIGRGDKQLRLNWVHKEAHFQPDNGYPVAYLPTKGKQLTIGGLTMAQIKQGFGIEQEMSASFLQIGKISRSLVDQALVYADPFEAVEFKNKACKLSVFGHDLDIPDNFGFTKTKNNLGTRFVFKSHPVLHYSILNADCSAVAITKDRVTLELPGAPDVWFLFDP